MENDRFLHLIPQKVLETVQKLRIRIHQRFPDSGLAGVCEELETVCSRSTDRIEWIARPIWPLRILRYGLLTVVAAGMATMMLSLRPGQFGEELTFAEWIQTLEAGLNDLVMIGIAVFFVWTLESRVKRRRALSALHELRSIAHVIDMHQLTKDPDRAIGNRFDTESSPKVNLNAYDLRRYLDYCSEMLSLTSKVAALHLQTLDDPTVVATVNEIEDLTTGLSRKIWQKIDIVRGLDEG
ncbi:MAG: hypothetical protein HKN23_00590 [Verrucomicrobiales bacterium]|nr:hypothetical protein [Verrucomicrobiales bacterium]